MPMALSLSTGITLSKGLESTDIDSQQTQQESASILTVLRAPTPADIVPMLLIIHVLTPTIYYVLW